MSTKTAGRRTALWRAVAVLALAGMVGGLLAAGPAIGAKKPLTKKKAHKLFLTPAEGDAAYLNVGEGLESKVIYQRGATVELATGSDEPFQATCPAGARAIGGGFYAENDGMFASSSFPSDPSDAELLGFTAWTTWVQNDSMDPGDVTPYAVCLPAATVDANFAAGADPQ